VWQTTNDGGRKDDLGFLQPGRRQDATWAWQHMEYRITIYRCLVVVRVALGKAVSGLRSAQI